MKFNEFFRDKKETINEGELTEEQMSKICVACQRCCKEVHVQTGILMNDEESVEFYRARGFITENRNGKVYLRMNVPCPSLTEKGCGIYEKRPVVCRVYTGESLGDICPLNKIRRGEHVL